MEKSEDEVSRTGRPVRSCTTRRAQKSKQRVVAENKTSKRKQQRRTPSPSVSIVSDDTEGSVSPKRTRHGQLNGGSSKDAAAANAGTVVALVTSFDEGWGYTSKKKSTRGTRMIARPKSAIDWSQLAKPNTTSVIWPVPVRKPVDYWDELGTLDMKTLAHECMQISSDMRKDDHVLVVLKYIIISLSRMNPLSWNLITTDKRQWQNIRESWEAEKGFEHHSKVGSDTYRAANGQQWKKVETIVAGKTNRMYFMGFLHQLLNLSSYILPEEFIQQVLGSDGMSHFAALKSTEKWEMMSRRLIFNKELMDKIETLVDETVKPPAKFDIVASASKELDEDADPEFASKPIPASKEATAVHVNQLTHMTQKQLADNIQGWGDHYHSEEKINVQSSRRALLSHTSMKILKDNIHDATKHMMELKRKESFKEILNVVQPEGQCKLQSVIEALICEVVNHEKMDDDTVWKLGRYLKAMHEITQEHRNSESDVIQMLKTGWKPEGSIVMMEATNQQDVPDNACQGSATSAGGFSAPPRSPAGADYDILVAAMTDAELEGIVNEMRETDARGEVLFSVDLLAADIENVIDDDERMQQVSTGGNGGNQEEDPLESAANPNN